MAQQDLAHPRYAGIFPVAPTPFTETGALDLDGKRRVLDCMIDQGVDGIASSPITPSSSCCPTSSGTRFSRRASNTSPGGFPLS